MTTDRPCSAQGASFAAVPRIGIVRSSTPKHKIYVGEAMGNNTLTQTQRSTQGFHLTSKLPADARFGNCCSNAVLSSFDTGAEASGSLFKTTRLMLSVWIMLRIRWVRSGESSQKSKKYRVGLRNP